MDIYGDIIKGLIIDDIEFFDITNMISSNAQFKFKQLPEKYHTNSKFKFRYENLLEIISTNYTYFEKMDLFYEIVHCINECSENNERRLIILTEILMDIYPTHHDLHKEFFICSCDILSEKIINEYEKNFSVYEMTVYSILHGSIRHATSIGMLTNSIIKTMPESSCAVKMIKNNIHKKALFYYYPVENFQPVEIMSFINRSKIFDFIDCCFKDEEFFIQQLGMGLKLFLEHIKNSRPFIDHDILLTTDKLYIKYPPRYFQ